MVPITEFHGKGPRRMRKGARAPARTVVLRVSLGIGR